MVTRDTRAGGTLRSAGLIPALLFVVDLLIPDLVYLGDHRHEFRLYIQEVLFGGFGNHHHFSLVI